MPKSELRIDIFDTIINISTDEAPEYLNALLLKYQEKIETVQNKTGFKDPLKTAILTGFLLCDDIEKIQAQTKEKLKGSAFESNFFELPDEESGEAERLTLKMISRLDELVPDSRPAEAENRAETKSENADFYRLEGKVKHYDWGSTKWLPDLLGQKNISRIPWAEIWYNAKSAPLLLKLLAAAKPLSIQAHPSREQAREGFERENLEGIPVDAPNRNYRDYGQKDEILCALGTYVILCGFRTSAEIKNLIEILSAAIDEESIAKDSLDSLILALEQEEENPLQSFLSALFRLESEVLGSLGSFLRADQEQLEKSFPEYKAEWGLCSHLSNLYPCDPGILAPLYLNVIELQNGQAVYIPAGTLHTSIYGLGIELSAYSDNVLRGGLTPKHINREGLIKILNFTDYMPVIMKAPEPAPSLFNYPTPSEDFSLSVIHGSGAALPYQTAGPSIVVITGGTALAEQSGYQKLFLNSGESLFIPGGIKLTFSGNFTAYSAVSKTPASAD